MVLSNIPMPPSSNNAYPQNKFGRRFKSKYYLDWEDKMQEWCILNTKKVVQSQKLFNVETSSQVINVKINFYFPSNKLLTKLGKIKKIDPSNRIKLLHDGLSKIIGLDDCYFQSSSYKTYVIPTHLNCEAYCDVEMEWELATWAV